jgi:hypothetical protein
MGLLPGLIAGGSGIVSTAAIKSNRHVKNMTYLLLIVSSESLVPWQAFSSPTAEAHKQLS